MPSAFDSGKMLVRKDEILLGQSPFSKTLLAGGAGKSQRQPGSVSERASESEC